MPLFRLAGAALFYRVSGSASTGQGAFPARLNVFLLSGAGE